MNTIDNIRWREVQYHDRRCGCCGAIAGTVLALALWGAIIAAVVALL